MRFRHCVLIAFLCLFTLTMPAQAQARTLAVAAAANLKAAMDVLKPAFEAKHPGCRLQVSLGSSGSFVAQIQQGAPFDVFLAADAEFPEKLRAAGFAQGESFPYATGHLVLWVRKDLGLDPTRQGLKVLLNPGIKHIAMGNPALAPFGRSAEAALRAEGLLEALKPKLVLGENITQAAQYVQSGAAEAGFISSPQALVPALASGCIWTVPQNLYPIQKQCGVVLKRTLEPHLAAEFRAFLIGPEAQAVLLKLGYGAP